MNGRKAKLMRRAFGRSAARQVKRAVMPGKSGQDKARMYRVYELASKRTSSVDESAALIINGSKVVSFLTEMHELYRNGRGQGPRMAEELLHRFLKQEPPGAIQFLVNHMAQFPGTLPPDFAERVLARAAELGLR